MKYKIGEKIRRGITNIGVITNIEIGYDEGKHSYGAVHYVGENLLFESEIRLCTKEEIKEYFTN